MSTLTTDTFSITSIQAYWSGFDGPTGSQQTLKHHIGGQRATMNTKHQQGSGTGWCSIRSGTRSIAKFLQLRAIGRGGKGRGRIITKIGKGQSFPKDSIDLRRKRFARRYHDYCPMQEYMVSIDPLTGTSPLMGSGRTISLYTCSLEPEGFLSPTPPSRTPLSKIPIRYLRL